MAERGKSFGDGYKFGFNNQEKDSELGDAYAFEYRIHDARLGRFLSVDPLAPEYPWNSTYAFAENKVIQAIELEGLEAWYRSSDPTISNIAPSTNGPELASPEYFATRNLLSSSVPSDYVYVPQNLEPVAYGPLSNEYIRQNNLTLSPAGIPMKFINDYGKFQEYSKEYNFPIHTLALNGGASNQAKPVRQWSNPSTPEYSENQATNIYTSYLRANVSVYQSDDDGWCLTMRFYFTTNGPKNVTANQVPSVGIFLNTVVNDEFQIPFTLHPPYTNWPDPVLRDGQAIIKESGVDYLGQYTFSLRALDPMHDILDIDFDWNVIFNVNGNMENTNPFMTNENIRIYSPGDPTATNQP